MRTHKALKNIVVSLLMGLAVIIVNFVAQRIFVESLGVEYLGLNGLLTSIVAMLAVVELGLGSAIVYHLYAPLHKRDTMQISSIMHFYKIGYRVIAVSIVVLGLLLLPFLGFIVGENSVAVSIPIAYGLFIVNAAVSYLLSYKRSILYADQKNYIINAVHFGALVILNALQIWVLIATQNYYLYLVLRIVMTLVENVILNAIVNTQYKLNKNPERLSKILRKDIFTKIKGLLYHKIAGFVVTGSSSIIISVTLGIVTLGLYSNYLLIQTALYSLFLQVSSAIRASVGNLLVAESQAISFKVFNRLHFAGQALSVLCVSVFLVTSASFVTVWLGSEFVFSLGVTIALALSIYLYLIRWMAFHNFKEAAGVFYEDRFVPIVEAVINIVASLVLIYFFGLAGAFLGTALSSLALHAYSYPKYVYKGILGRSYTEYTYRFIRDLLIAVFVVCTTYAVSTLVHIDSILLLLGAQLAIAIIIPTVLLVAIYGRSDEVRYYKKLLVLAFRKIRVRIIGR